MSKIILGKFWSESRLMIKQSLLKNLLYISSNYINRFRDKKDFDYEYKDIDKIGENYRLPTRYLSSVKQKN